MSLKWHFLSKEKMSGRKLLNFHIVERIRESHPCVHDLLHQRLCKRHRREHIMNTCMGFPCPFCNMVKDSIYPFPNEVMDNFYVPGSNDWGHIVFVWSVCLSVCLLSPLTFPITFEP